MDADGPEEVPGEFGIEGIHPGGKFFPKTVDLLVEGIHAAVQVDDEITKVGKPAGIFFRFSFEVHDAFFQCGHRVLVGDRDKLSVARDAGNVNGP